MAANTGLLLLHTAVQQHAKEEAGKDPIDSPHLSQSKL